MAVAALVTWIVTAVGGFVLLGTWLARGGARESTTTVAASSRAGGSTSAPETAPTRLSPPLIFGHFLLAATGLVVWIVYLATDNDTLAWIALALLVPVAVLGFTMLARWLADGRATTLANRPESHFPVAVVAGHGLFAVATVLLVLLTVLGVGGG
jgi:manganese efflux pump family protein